VFGGVAGIFGLYGMSTWPTPLALVALLVLPAAIRSSELRGAVGAQGVGQGLIHVLAVVQVGAGAILLDLSVVATSALIALTFYTWAGAADALGQGATGRSVAAEFGSLMLIGLVVGLILSRA